MGATKAGLEGHVQGSALARMKDWVQGSGHSMWPKQRGGFDSN